jgi:hypothetical protein
MKGIMAMEERKRAGRPLSWLGAASLVMFLLSAGCDWGVPNYHLTVFLESGVTGTPEPGTYVYKDISVVEFSYSGVNPLHTVEVLLNDKIRNEGSGSIMMYGDGYELKARLVDVRGVWKVTLTYTDTTVTAPEPFLLTLTGPDLLSGTFSDARGYHGSWTAQSGVLTLAYWDWNFYVLSGTVFGLGQESGAFSGDGLSGTWTAQKQE